MNKSTLLETLGDGVEVPGPEITRAMLALFAGASGDHNPIHIDTDFAKAAGYNDVFAHGMLSIAFLTKALVTVVPQDDIRSVEVRFVSRTPVHATPKSSIALNEIAEVDGAEVARLDLVVVIGDGITTVVGSALVSLS